MVFLRCMRLQIVLKNTTTREQPPGIDRLYNVLNCHSIPHAFETNIQSWFNGSWINRLSCPSNFEFKIYPVKAVQILIKQLQTANLLKKENACNVSSIVVIFPSFAFIHKRSYNTPTEKLKHVSAHIISFLCLSQKLKYVQHQKNKTRTGLLLQNSKVRTYFYYNLCMWQREITEGSISKSSIELTQKWF